MQNRIYNHEQAGTCSLIMLQGPGRDQRAERTKNQTNLRQKAPRKRNEMDRNKKAKSW